MRRDTVDAWALKDLACFTARTHTIAFDLQIRIGSFRHRRGHSPFAFDMICSSWTRAVRQ
jgi:hypothetical protein